MNSIGSWPSVAATFRCKLKKEALRPSVRCQRHELKPPGCCDVSFDEQGHVSSLLSNIRKTVSMSSGRFAFTHFRPRERSKP